MPQQKLPAVLLLGAMDAQNKPIPEIAGELSSLKRLFKPYDNGRSILEMDYEPYITSKMLGEKLDEFVNRVTILHFAGHSNSDSLRLDDSIIYIEGLARIFKTWKQAPLLVFLNGCRNSDQVSSLHSAGVLIVIATHRPIEDKTAANFSCQFYNSLFSENRNATISNAFERASAKVSLSMRGTPRSINLNNLLEGNEKKWDWSLSPTTPELENWSLNNLLSHDKLIINKGKPSIENSPAFLTNYMNELFQKKDISQKAINSFFNILAVKNVPIENYTKELQGIANHYLFLKKQISELTVTNSDTEELKSKAEKFIEQGQHQKAESIIGEICQTQEKNSEKLLEKIEETKEKYRIEMFSLAESQATKGYSQQLRFDYLEAGESFVAASKTVEKYIDHLMMPFPNNKDNWHLAYYLSLAAKSFRLASNLKRAEKLFQRVLEIRTYILGPRHEDIASTMHNLAELYYRQNRLMESEALYKHAIKMFKSTLGPNSRRAASSMHGLALYYGQNNRMEEAESTLEEALRITKKHLKENDPRIAEMLNNLAVQFRRKKNYEKAQSLYLRSIAIKKKSLRPDDPSIASTINNLARIHELQNDLSKAELLYKESLEIIEINFGHTHYSAGVILHNLSALYFKKGNYEKSRELESKSEAVFKRIGGKNPWMLTTLEDPAFL